MWFYQGVEALKNYVSLDSSATMTIFLFDVVAIMANRNFQYNHAMFSLRLINLQSRRFSYKRSGVTVDAILKVL